MRKQLGCRMEQLEPRCLLSVASLAGDQLGFTFRGSYAGEPMRGGAVEQLIPELGLPRYNSQTQSYQPPAAPRTETPDAEPPKGGTPAETPDSYTPPIDTDKETVPDAGGQIEIGGADNFEGHSDGGLGGDAGAATPESVREDRESRAVLQMLAKLKYPVGSATTKHSGSAREALFADAVAESLSSTRPSSVRLDERTVDIAVSELAAEFEPAPAPLRAARESVLDVDVQMDRAAGRFQAFEVLTIDQTTTRTPAREAMREAEAAPTAAANDFGWSNQESASDEKAIAFHPLVQMQATAEQNPSAEGTSPLAYLYTLVDEQIGVTWNRAFALVVFGLIAYAFRLQHQSRPQVSPAGEGERAESPPPRHSGWFARYFKFASRIRAAASS